MEMIKKLYIKIDKKEIENEVDYDSSRDVEKRSEKIWI